MERFEPIYEVTADDFNSHGCQSGDVLVDGGDPEILQRLILDDPRGMKRRVSKGVSHKSGGRYFFVPRHIVEPPQEKEQIDIEGSE